MNTRYRVYQDFISHRWLIADMWQLNEVGARIVVQGLDEEQARRLAARWNAAGAQAPAVAA